MNKGKWQPFSILIDNFAKKKYEKNIENNIPKVFIDSELIEKLKKSEQYVLEILENTFNVVDIMKQKSLKTFEEIKESFNEIFMILKDCKKIYIIHQVYEQILENDFTISSIPKYVLTIMNVQLILKKIENIFLDGIMISNNKEEIIKYYLLYEGLYQNFKSSLPCADFIKDQKDEFYILVLKEIYSSINLAAKIMEAYDEYEMFICFNNDNYGKKEPLKKISKPSIIENLDNIALNNFPLFENLITIGFIPKKYCLNINLLEKFRRSFMKDQLNFNIISYYIYLETNKDLSKGYSWKKRKDGITFFIMEILKHRSPNSIENRIKTKYFENFLQNQK